MVGDVDILRRIEDNLLNDPEVMESQESWSGQSDICGFFRGRNIFVTGGTGFIGCTLIEKLLRSCPHIGNIYMLIRDSNGKTAEQKLNECFSNVFYDTLRKKRPNFQKKIFIVRGDVTEPGLGISAQDKEAVIQNVSIFFHGAATVKFDSPLDVAVGINVRGTASTLELARQCPKLLAFIHVSTAFSNCVHNEIDEAFYTPPMEPHQVLDLIKRVPKEKLDIMTPTLLGDFPNTYTYSKQIAEEVIREYGRGLPICVFRPSIVMSTYKEPIAGWSNSIYGPTGVLIGAGTGVIRTIECNPNKVADLVPVDMTVNALIACAWTTARKTMELTKNNVKTVEEPKVFNYVSGPRQPITWREFLITNKKYGMSYPTMKCIWYYSFTMNQHRALHILYTILLHFLPALLVDAYLKISGRETRLVKLYKKIYKFTNTIKYFTKNQWSFVDKNIQSLWKDLSKADKYLFPFDMSGFDWEEHARTQLLGLRVYLVGDDVSTIPQAKIRWRRFYILHRTIQVVAAFIILRILWAIISHIFL